ncbi:MAG: right-handed parallel beta-helix repeat-containing protein, partial [Methanobacterium sp.]|uniref:right-handed parallel beta-helix repeat-containing protein n=1 Tax=Methanobacterium sp. TaxID=2164 RepID=UPI003C75932D
KVPPVVNNSTVPPVTNTTKVPPVVNNSTVPPVTNTTTPVFPQGVTIISTVAQLTSALNNAISGSTIYLSSGVFNINGLTISKNIILQGAGQNLTIFNGNGNSILTVGNVQATINDIQFVGGASSYGGALTNDGTLTLNRDTFTGNTASKYGGAINNNKILNVNNCLFTNNTTPGAFEIGYGSGSAILNNAGCTLAVTKSTFSGNTAGSYAAIFQLGSGTITNCNFINNTSGEGSSVYTSGIAANSQVTNCTFTDNQAISGAGGALSEYHSNSNVVNCTFTGNSALKGGGAIYNDGQDTSASVQSSITVSGSTFINNKAGSNYGGGAIMTYAGPMTVSNSTFTGNTAGNGGALYNYDGVFVLNNNTVSGNSAPAISQVTGG